MLHASRREARADAHGAMVTLELQDRTHWDRDPIARGTTVLDRAMTLRAAGGGLGVYQVQAPGEGLFIGDPLARPYGPRARVEGERVKITTTALKVGPYRVEAAPAASGPWSTVESGSLPHRQRVDIDVARRAAFYRLAQ